MKVTTEMLIDALVNNWEYLCHDSYDPEDQSPEDYRKDLETYTWEQLVDEVGEDGEDLAEFCDYWA